MPPRQRKAQKTALDSSPSGTVIAGDQRNTVVSRFEGNPITEPYIEMDAAPHYAVTLFNEGHWYQSIDFCESDTSNRCTGRNCTEDENYKERFANLTIDLFLFKFQNKEFYEGFPLISDKHPHVYTHIRSLKLSSISGDFSTSFLNSLLVGLIVHGQGSLEVLELNPSSWTNFKPSTQGLLIHLIKSCPRLHTFSLYAFFPILRYSLDFLGVLKGLKSLKLCGFESPPFRYNASQVVETSNRLSSSPSNNERMFLQQLFLRGEAAERLAQYLEYSQCPLEVSSLHKLYILDEGEKLGSGVARILNCGASASIRTLAWMPSSKSRLVQDDSYFGTSNIEITEELHPLSLVLLTTQCNYDGKRFGFGDTLTVLSSSFKLRTDKVQELILGYRGLTRTLLSIEQEKLNQAITQRVPHDWANISMDVYHGLTDVLKRINQEFKALRGQFPNLQTIKIYLAPEYQAEAWEAFNELQTFDISEYWTPSMGGNWEPSENWKMASIHAPDIHNTGMLSWKIVPLQAGFEIFDQMVESSTLDAMME